MEEIDLQAVEQTEGYPVLLSVVIPARNEEECLGACLESLVGQSALGPGWELGRDWEIIVVNDGSTDRTREIAGGFAGVRVLDAGEPEAGWTGKANAIATGVRAARGQWLLFTDADTVHEAGHLSLAIAEAERHGVGMLSYSPRQVVTGLVQRALMPLIFSELAVLYSPKKVNNPESRVAAANGQFMLVRRDAYEKVGGHAAVMDSVLDDVRLAEIFKRRKLGLRFRNAPEAVSARMYRSVGALWEGWRKNLALLVGNPLTLAAWRLLDLVLLVGLPFAAWWVWEVARYGKGAYWAQYYGLAVLLIWMRTLWRFYGRVARSHFRWGDVVLSPLALPLFAVLLYQSWFDHTVKKRVVWKGRAYKDGKG